MYFKVKYISVKDFKKINCKKCLTSNTVYGYCILSCFVGHPVVELLLSSQLELVGELAVSSSL